jgi:hypothetical protein
MRGSMIDGRLRLVPKEDIGPATPGFIYTPRTHWTPRRGRFVRLNLRTVGAACVAFWALVGVALAVFR